MNNISIKIDYDAFFSGGSLEDLKIEDFKGITEFKDDLSSEYVTYIKGHGVGRGGLVYDLIIEMIMNVSLKDFLEIIAGGIAYDLVKYGTKSLVLRPFILAFEKFNSLNNNSVRIGTFRLKFEESDIVINSINKSGIFHIVPQVFEKFLSHYQNLKHPLSNLFPDEVRIPVIYDSELEKDNYVKYRELLEMENFG